MLSTKLDNLLSRYIPRKDDQIDEALAEFINNYPEFEKMKIMFLRESNGVYSFGQRKVHIKIEKGNQIFVRVGGGFLHVKDFINEFTKQELERLERRDVLARFHDKVAIQNIAAQHSSAAVESVPLVKNQMMAQIPTISQTTPSGYVVRRDPAGNNVPALHQTTRYHNKIRSESPY